MRTRTRPIGRPHSSASAPDRSRSAAHPCPQPACSAHTVSTPSVADRQGPHVSAAPPAATPASLSLPSWPHPSGRRLPHAARSLSTHLGLRVGSIPLLPPEFPAPSTFYSASPNPTAQWTSRPRRPTGQPRHHLLESAPTPDHATPVRDPLRPRVHHRRNPRDCLP